MIESIIFPGLYPGLSCLSPLDFFSIRKQVIYDDAVSSEKTALTSETYFSIEKLLMTLFFPAS
ncbi:MAG: hypothetical protein QGG87_06840, partial [Nitrospinota bacterium]|nr:hypothetical protein [Nitrospinota bacterium]